MIIYKPNNEPFIDIDVDDESYHFAEIMGRNDVTLYFSLPQYLEFPIGCYIEYMASTYTLYSVDKMRMQHRRDFEYTMTFESEGTELDAIIYSNPNDGRFKFPLTAKPQEHLSLLCQCLSAKTGVTWTPHCLIEASDKLISYDAMYCLDALGQIAQTFETEYRISGRDIYLGKVEFYKDVSEQVALSYGRGNGLRPGVEKVLDNTGRIIGKVYIQGGERNIDFSQYGSSTLLLPKNTHIWYDGRAFYDSAHTGATEFVTSADGRYVSLASSDAPISEGALDLSDVYPSYDHEVSSAEEVDAENHFWDIYSDTFTAGKSTATKVNYEDCLIANDGDMTIIFQSGALSGREFGVHWQTKNVTEGNTTTEVAYMEIVPSEQDGIPMPDRTTGFYPRVGDVFRVFNIYLPESYILSAEIEMLHQAVSYLYENCREKFSIKGEVDPIWSASRWLNIGSHFKPGAYFRFSDPVWADEGVSIRVTSVKTFINKPHQPIVELSNSIGRMGVSSALKRIEAEAKVLPEVVKKDSLSFTKRSFADAKETMSALAEAMLNGFTEQISPITVQTMQAIVGDESLQFRFWTNRSCTTPITNPFTYDTDNKQLTAISCALQHMTLGITDIKPSAARQVTEYLRWNMQAYESAILDEPTKRYYVYAKCDALNNGTNHLAGEFILSEQAIGMEDAVIKSGDTITGGYYHFLCGILNSERDKSRSFAPVFGYTEILPGQITTDVIRSASGNSYFDLVSNAFNLGDKLKFNVNNDGQLVLNGTFVQTGSGATAPIGGWCGEYVSTRTYKKGDEVWYQVGDAVSSYIYINDTPSSGNDPTNAAYWEATSVGAEGGSGQGVFKSIVFVRSDTAPDTPTGGSYLSPVPSGWSDGVPFGSQILWISTRVFTSDGNAPQQSSWTAPEQATSGDEIEFRWNSSSSEPSSPGSGSGGSLSWTASRGSYSWITLNKTSGTGSDTLTYSVAANTGTSARTGYITISYSGGSKTFTVTQSGSGSSGGSIAPTSISAISASGGSQVFNIADSSNVGWSLSKSGNWIALSRTSGTGSTSVTATFSANSGTSSRSGSITFSCGSTVTNINVTQNAGSTPSGGSATAGSVTVTFPATITSEATAIRFTISDPSNHGWELNTSNWWQYTTAGTRISGNISIINADGATGTGDAVFEISVKSGSSTLNGANVVDSTTNDRESFTINRN